MKKIVLASNSPRRRELIAGLDLDYEIRVLPGVAEEYPADMPAEEVSEYIAIEKSQPYRASMHDNEIVITADTTVILDGSVIGKPYDDNDARRMLHRLSGRTHHVVTGVCLTTTTRQRHFSVKTDVTFKPLSDEEIDYYVSHYHPLDKAGAYGVQEWIGYIGVTALNGSYYNVMGFPVQRVYTEIMKMENEE